VLPMNTGAEAVETAIKLARKWGYDHKQIPAERAEIIVFDGNFHGRTTTIVGFSSDPLARTGFGPFTPGFVRVPYGRMDAVRSAITDCTAAVLVEPIQGEAGVIIPPDGFLPGLRELCSQNHVLLIADEIQTGLARTGRLLACNHEGVKPDVYLLGKALGGGLLPVSAVVSTREVLGVLKPGEHGSTFGGNPLAAAVGRAVVRMLREGDWSQRAAKLGDYFKQGLCANNSPKIREVRGRGLLTGLELNADAGSARRLCELLLERRLLCKDTHRTVVRLAPPLTIEQSELDWALEQISAAIHEL